MIVLRCHLDHAACTWSLDGQSYTAPVGSATLTALLTTDPPHPADLTNSVGLLVDHLDDVTREVIGAEHADRVELHGPGLHTFANVEVGGSVELPYTVSRPAAEEVFRTLVIESDAERLLNPGLPADEQRSILGVACAVVAVLRGLDIGEIVVCPAESL